jgi:hypothetical protein
MYKGETTNDPQAKISAGAIKYDGGKAPIYRGALSYFPRAIELVAAERLSTLGKDGKGSMTELTDTLMQWYDTLPTKEKVKFWTLTLDFFTLDTPLGTPSRGLSF